METNQNQAPQPTMTEEQILLEILENSRKAKTYMKWQLYITIVLVVLPLLAAVFLVPMALSGLSSAYTSAGLLQ